MTSLDSIGSCSLDAYASSSEGTDPFSGAPKHTSEHPKGHGHVQHKAGEQGDDELASACTLCSVSALSSPSPASPLSGVGAVGAFASKAANAVSQSPEYVRKTARLFEGSDRQQQEETDFLNIPAAKKPSYLGLACSLSGYSGLTSYDSKLREGFRTRDKSPAPPPPRPLTTSNMSKSSPSKSSPPAVNGIGCGTAANGIPVSPRATRTNRTMSKESSKESGSSSLRESSRQFMSAMLSDEADFTNCTRMINVVHSRGPSPSTPKDSLSPGGSTPSALKRSPGTVRVVEFTSQTKSYVSGIVSTTTSRTLQTGTAKEVHQFTSEISVDMNGADGQATPKTSRISHVESEQTVPSGYCISKSFVQQRIERLYGPGALAQGFFSRTRQLSLSEEESIPQSPDRNGTGSGGSPALPVLRHLRPEFRAQLPLTSPGTSRSPRHVKREIPSVYESPTTQPHLQQQTSVESLSDSQPAAPEVPVLVGEILPVTNSLKSGEALKSPLLCKEASNTIKHETTLDKPVVNPDNSFAHGKTSNLLSSYDKSDLITEEEEKDGHYFLKVLRSEIQRLNKLVESAEEELDKEPRLPEEAQGKLRAASGQARLLVKQKLQQFEGLCHKNISQSPDEVFPTTAQDLAGFWDMVKLQIDHVDRLFIEIDHLKSLGWKETATESMGGSVGSSSSGARHRSGSQRRPTSGGGSSRSAAGGGSSRSSAGGGSRSKNSEDQKKGEGARKKEEQAQARKRMLEEKRRLLRQQQQQAREQENIEIFVPHENGK